MGIQVRTDHLTEVLDLLRDNALYEFGGTRSYHPNGWLLWGKPRNQSWIASLFSKRETAIICPPYCIETNSLGLAAAMHLSLNGTDFKIRLNR